MKILLVDIETTPNLGYTWGKYEQNVIEFKQEWQLLSFAYKWLGEGTPIKCITREGEFSDKGLSADLWDLFDQADVIIAHNGDAFDIRKAKAKFVEHGFPPPSPFRSIDTKKIAKQAFKFNSNSLDDLGALLKVGRKMKHQGFDLWKGCMADDAKSWRTMARYNKQDIILLEKVYKKLRGWSKSAPLEGFVKGFRCPKCDGKTHRIGLVTTTNGTFPRYRCVSCGGVSRSSTKITLKPGKLRAA